MTTYEEMEQRGPVVSNGEGEGRPLADVIYIYVDRNRPGIKLNVYSKSDKYYDKFMVGTYVEKVSYPDEEPITGVITKERIYPVGSRARRSRSGSDVPRGRDCGCGRPRAPARGNPSCRCPPHGGASRSRRGRYGSDNSRCSRSGDS